MVAVPDVPTDGSASNTNKTLGYDLNNCTSSHRLTWHVMQYGYKKWKVKIRALIPISLSLYYFQDIYLNSDDIEQIKSKI